MFYTSLKAPCCSALKRTALVRFGAFLWVDASAVARGVPRAARGHLEALRDARRALGAEAVVRERQGPRGAAARRTGGMNDVSNRPRLRLSETVTHLLLAIPTKSIVLWIRASFLVVPDEETLEAMATTQTFPSARASNAVERPILFCSLVFMLFSFLSFFRTPRNAVAPASRIE